MLSPGVEGRRLSLPLRDPRAEADRALRKEAELGNRFSKRPFLYKKRPKALLGDSGGSCATVAPPDAGGNSPGEGAGNGPAGVGAGRCVKRGAGEEGVLARRAIPVPAHLGVKANGIYFRVKRPDASSFGRCDPEGRRVFRQPSPSLAP